MTEGEETVTGGEGQGVEVIMTTTKEEGIAETIEKAEAVHISPQAD
jgi:hypothetical protein